MVSVPLGRERAFWIFTVELDRWWPTETHSLSGSVGRPPTRCAIELHEGGRLIEESRAGDELVWGVVSVWEPPFTLRLEWRPGSTAGPYTLVSLAFDEQEGGSTGVLLEQSGFELLGDEKDAIRERTACNASWPSVLEAYRQECVRRAV